MLSLAVVCRSWSANGAAEQSSTHKDTLNSYLYWFLYQLALLPNGRLLCFNFTVRTKDDVCWLVLWRTILEWSSKALYKTTLSSSPCQVYSPPFSLSNECHHPIIFPRWTLMTSLPLHIQLIKVPSIRPSRYLFNLLPWLLPWFWLMTFPKAVPGSRFASFDFLITA